MKPIGIILLLILFITLANADEAKDKSILLLDSFNGSQNDTFHYTLSYEHLTSLHFSFSAGLSLVQRDNQQEPGAEFRIRYNLPNKLSPYAGIGFFTGRSIFYVAFDDAVGEISDEEEQKYYDEYLNAFYPEVGVNLWLTDNVKVNVGIKYFAASKGHNASQWMYGVGAGFSF